MGVKILVTCDTGFEGVLEEELKEILSFNVVEKASGRLFIEVSSSRDIAEVLRSRVANKIYTLLLLEKRVGDLDEIYRVVKSIDFAGVIEPWQSFAIRSERIGEHSFTSIDIARVAGQAVIDSYRESKGARLRVDLENPDIEIYVELNVDRLTVALSMTRSSLHARNYKLFIHPAGLKPTIASALLRVASWRPGEPIVDPMCGGGTIAIEAALASKGVEVPCLSADSIDINTLNRLYPEAYNHLKELCTQGRKDVDRVFIGMDINPRFVEGAIVNAKNAGVDDVTLFFVGDLRKLIPKIKAVEHEFGAVFDKAVFNPPYGYRMKPGSIRKLYRETLRTLIDYGFKTIVFITSATKVCKEVLESLGGIDVYAFRVVHGTLPSYVYKLKI